MKTGDPGVPLAQYHDLGADVLLTCLDCLERRAFPLEVVINRLVARRVGGEWTGIKAVAGFVRDPCPRGAAAGSFDTSPAFPVRQKGGGWESPVAY